ncbi:hypothetical protein ABTP59_18720, partial [Acinetobacter baumannii]
GLKGPPRGAFTDFQGGGQKSEEKKFIHLFTHHSTLFLLSFFTRLAFPHFDLVAITSHKYFNR